MQQTKHSRFMAVGAVCLAAVGASLVTPSAHATPQTFNFQDPKSVNVITITLDSLLEPSTGLAHDITGTVKFDPQAANSLTGKITVSTASLNFANATYTEAAHSDKGLDAKQYPQITFDIKSVSNFKTTRPNVFNALVTGDFSLHGVTRRIAVPVTATFLPGKVAERSMGMAKGDLLVLRSTFNVKRSDYHIAAMMPAALVAENVQVHIAIAGTGK